MTVRKELATVSILAASCLFGCSSGTTTTTTTTTTTAQTTSSSAAPATPAPAVSQTPGAPGAPGASGASVPGSTTTTSTSISTTSTPPTDSLPSQMTSVKFAERYTVQVPSNFKISQSPPTTLTAITAIPIGDIKPREGATLVLDRATATDAFSMSQMIDGEMAKLNGFSDVKKDPEISLTIDGIPFQRIGFSAQSANGETYTGFVMLGKDGPDVVCAFCGCNPVVITSEYEQIVQSLKKQ